MKGLIIKLFVCPITVILASILFAQVHYPALYQPILVGIVLALVGYGMETLVLRKGTIWTSTILDFSASAAIVYFSALIFAGARVTLLGALLTAFLLGLTEHLQHKMLVESGRTQK